MIIKFHDIEVNSEELINRNSRMVSHCWGDNWTRIEIPIPDFWAAPSTISDWINENLSQGKFGMFYIEDHANANDSVDNMHTWDNKKYKLIISFEHEDDALMFKLLDGHVAYEKFENI